MRSALAGLCYLIVGMLAVAPMGFYFCFRNVPSGACAWRCSLTPGGLFKAQLAEGRLDLVYLGCRSYLRHAETRVSFVGFRVEKYPGGMEFGSHVCGRIGIPLWTPAVLIGGVWTLPRVHRAVVRRRRRERGVCVECCYDLTGNASGVCPECGAKMDTSGDRERRGSVRAFARRSPVLGSVGHACVLTLAVAGVSLGLMSIFVWCYCVGVSEHTRGTGESGIDATLQSEGSATSRAEDLNKELDLPEEIKQLFEEGERCLANARARLEVNDALRAYNCFLEIALSSEATAAQKAEARRQAEEAKREGWRIRREILRTPKGLRAEERGG